MGKETRSRITEFTNMCLICDGQAEHSHHTLSGSDRKKADKFGLTIPLCPTCHNMFKGGKPLGWRCDVHGCPKLERLTKIIGQLSREQQIMEETGCSAKDARNKFRMEFMKSYL